MKTRFSPLNKQNRRQIYIRDENGSMILVVLMLLALMSIIGIASTNTVITENFIVRNTAIRKENLHMIDSVATEAYQRVSDITYVDQNNPMAFMFPDQIKPDMPGHFHWVHDKDAWKAAGLLADWYDRELVGRVLVPANSAVPQSISGANPLEVVDNRGEWDGVLDNSPIRYALTGWDFVSEGENIVVNDPGLLPKKKATILVEYVSEDYGVIRLVVGIIKRI